jgi:DNA-binding CsgD family transcriptional regulator
MGKAPPHLVSVEMELCLPAAPACCLTQAVKVDSSQPPGTRWASASSLCQELLVTEDAPLPMREEIVVSWFRSVRSGVRSDHFEVPYDSEIDGQSRLAWAARPVLEGLAEDLAGTSTGLVLTDDRGHIVARHVSDRSLRAWLDRIELAPGFRYSEEHVGTNAIGTALAVQRPFVVEGGEHFADILSTMACAATLITDPRTGNVLGAVDLSCRAENASPLMMSVAKRAAWEIEQHLLEDASVAERTLREHFVRARRRTRNALVSLNERTMLANAMATGVLQPGDHELLWEWVSRALAGHQPVAPEVWLTGGTWVVKTFEPLQDGGRFVGASLCLEPPSSRVAGSRGGPLEAGHRPRFGWASLTGTELRVADLVAQGMTNRQVAAQLYLSPHTVGFHLRQVFRKLEIGSRVELTRMVVERHADRRPPGESAALTGLRAES